MSSRPEQLDPSTPSTTSRRDDEPLALTAHVIEPDPAVPDMAWVLRAGTDSTERSRRTQVFQAYMASVSGSKADQPESGKVYQLAFWSDDKRAMPTDFIRSALFAGIQAKDAVHVDGELIANANDLKIIYTGQRLTQVHADVWEGIMYLARQYPEGKRVTFKARQFLKLIGRHTGKSQRVELRRLFRQLTATSVEIHDARNKRRFWGSLLPTGADVDEQDDTLYVVELNRGLAQLFDRGFSTIDWQQRRKLLKKPLALWLQHYFSDHRKPITVAFLHKHSGSTARSLRHFREQLRKALDELVEVGVIGTWRIGDADTVFVSAAAGQMPPITPHQSQLALPGAAQVSDRGRKRFEKEFPGKDFSACLHEWQSWEGSKQARFPDAAFLGWVRNCK
jgi:hypothetical protein